MFAYFRVPALGLLAVSLASSQGLMTTVAGGSGVLDNIPAVQARIVGPNGLAVDVGGNAYITDDNRIRKVNGATGVISTLITFSTQSVSGVPFALAWGAGGKLVVISTGQMQFLDPGSGTLTGFGSLPADSILAGVATDSAGDIFLSDEYNDKIYRVDAASGALTTFAGTGMVGHTGNPIGDGGPATQAGLGRPAAITVDGAGNVYFAEQYWLRRIDGETGIITTIATNSTGAASGDGGPYNKAVFTNITALATDAQGNLYVGGGGRVRKIDWTSGTVSTVAGSGQSEYGADGVPATSANLSYITAVVVDAQNDIWIADNGNARLFFVSGSTGLIHTVAGTSQNGDGGPATGALISDLRGLAVNAQGDLYFLAMGLRRVDHATHTITTAAFPPVTGSQPITYTLGNGASPLALDAAGNIYFSEAAVLQRVDADTGAVTTVAGNGLGQYGGGPLGDNGPATRAQVTPAGSAIDANGNIYIADYWNERIRRVDAATGVITTVAGNGQGQVFSGETGPATQISIGVPDSIAIGPDGGVYWTTAGSVLKLDSAGNLSIVAGNGGCVYAGDGGPATLAPLCGPQALSFDEAGNLFVSESSCSCVRRVDAVTGIIQTVAGTGAQGQSGDGIPATQAALSAGAIAYYAGTLYIDDAPQLVSNPPRVRAVDPPSPPALPQPPSITEIDDAVDFRSAFSPGALISVFGNYLGPATPSVGQFGSDGRVTSALVGDQVTINGIASPLLYASASQINAIVPYAIPPNRTPVPVVVNTAAGSANSSIFVSPTSISLFTNIIVNPDGSLNSATHPAPKGATLVFYGTGMGQTSPASADGVIAQGPPLASPLASFSASISQGSTSYAASLQYLGPLPGFVDGAVQANIQLPATLPAGKSQVYVRGPSGDETLPAAIYSLSDTPVITGITPASPEAQPNLLNTITINGQFLTGVAFQFFLNSQPVNIAPQQFQPCTATSCTLQVNFNGVAGQYGVTATNAGNQVSNNLAFTVQP